MSGPRIAGGTHRRLKIFAVTQIAASFLLLAGASVLIRTLLSMQSAPTCFETHRVLGDHTGDLVVGRGRNNYPVTFVVLPGRRIELILAYHRDLVIDDTAWNSSATFGNG